MSTTAVAKKTSTSLQRVDSVDFQMEMFKKFKLSPLMVETHRFEPRPGGKFALVKRAAPIRLFDDNGRAAFTAAASAPCSNTPPARFASPIASPPGWIATP